METSQQNENGGQTVSLSVSYFISSVGGLNRKSYWKTITPFFGKQVDILQSYVPQFFRISNGKLA